jgi:hypothetical protein
MSDRNTIQDELNELNSGLNPAPGDNPFSVPEGYFEGLASSILAKIKGEAPLSAGEEIAQLSPLLAGISRQLPYSVPEGYFQSNVDGLKAFTSEDEESLVLSFLNKDMPYEVPMGYFANLPGQILEKVSAKGAKVVHLGARKWMRYAVAAAVTGIIAISGFFYFNNRGGSKASSDPVVAVKKASIQELDDFIKTTAVNDEKAQVTAKNTATKTDRKKIFSDVSDKELNAFLDQMPADDVMDIN